jgi:hypothetical protein
MFSEKARKISKGSAFKLTLVCLTVLFLVVVGPGLLNIGSSRALAHDGRNDRGHHKPVACAQTSKAALTACRNSASSDYWLGIGACDNISDPQEKKACLDEARSSLKDDYNTCNEQFVARQEVCRELGQGPYDPVLDPQDFFSDITNIYSPFPSGNTYTYKSTAPGTGTQTIVVKVGDTTTIDVGGDSFDCLTVTDKVYDGNDTNGNLLEDTIDWYSQDGAGNVWYFGETTIAYTYDDAGNPTASTEGSWMAGMDEAKPGIIMPANPEAQINKLYRQEFFLGTAEDLGKVVGTNETVTAGDVEYTRCVHTHDTSPLEPGVIEDKWYAPNVGLVLTIGESDGTREELTSFTSPPPPSP